MFHTRVWQYATYTPGAWKGQKRELVFSGAVATDGCELPCVLGIETKFSERAASTANCETNPSAPPALFLSIWEEWVWINKMNVLALKRGFIWWECGLLLQRTHSTDISSQTLVTPAPGDQMTSSGLHGQAPALTCTYSHRGTHMCIPNLNWNKSKNKHI